MSPTLPASHSPRARFGLHFSMLARRWRQFADAQLAAEGLTDATWVPLVHLHETGGGLTQKALAARVGIDGSSLVRLLDILSRDGLVERRIDPDDARARRVHLTAAGRARVVAIRKTLVRAETEMLDGLGDADIAAMLAHFEHITRRLDALQPERAAAAGTPA